MTTVALTTAIATYGHPKALKEGLVPPPRLTMEHLACHGGAGWTGHRHSAPVRRD